MATRNQYGLHIQKPAATSGRSFISYDLSGFEELAKALEALPEAVADRALRGAAIAGANVIRDAARERAPVRSSSELKKISKKNDRRRGPGYLKTHIVSRVNKFSKYDVRVDIGAARDAFYLLMVELGAKHMGPTPVLRAALQEKQMDAVRVFGERLTKNIARECKRVGKKINLRYLTKGRY